MDCSRVWTLSDSLSLCSAKFWAVMERTGFSSAKGSQARLPAGRFAGHCALLPVHAGIVPAAFPAFIAPIGVNVVPRLCTSSAEAAAWLILKKTECSMPAATST
ncbi:hypothetical protein D3C81_1692490 [compost metagenome]